VGADVGALVEPELVVEAEDKTAFVNRGAHPVHLATRLVCGHQMLVTVLDPFDRPPEAQRSGAGQHILGIELAANAETTADMTLVQVNPARRQPEHRLDCLAIEMRHLGGAIHAQDTARFVRHRDRAARFERDAAVPCGRQFELDHRMRLGERSVEIAIGLGDDSGLGVKAGREFTRRRCRIEARRQRLDKRLDEIGDVLRHISIGGEHQRDRLTDITDIIVRQHRLAIRLQPWHRGQAKADRRDIDDIGGGPDGDRAGMRERLVEAKIGQPAKGDRRAHHAHADHVRKF
jgi:hypothetical protein